MEENVKKLLIQAFENDAAAWRQLALLLTVQESDVDAELCRIFLNKAIELGDEESFFVYHQLFSAGNIPVDDASYRAGGEGEAEEVFAAVIEKSVTEDSGVLVG